MVLLNYGNFSLEINVSLEPEDLFVAVFGFIEVAKTQCRVKEKLFAATSPPMANCLLLVVMIKRHAHLYK
jgi:hypothetical protein